MGPSHRQIIFASLAMFITMLFVASPTRGQTPDAKPLTSEQLEQLVAPIALYPDDLLSQVLMASTYPLEVVEAARWSRDNPKVTGKALEDAMQKQEWDPSVKALTAVPQTLQMMNDQLAWTQDLGDAFLAQQTDVLDAVQRLRARADAAGNLKSTSQQTVRRVNRPANVSAASGAPATAYEIVPTTPDEYYVPIYDPSSRLRRVAVSRLPSVLLVPARLRRWPVRIWRGRAGWRRDLGRRQLVEPECVYQRHRYNQFNRTNITNGNWSHNVAHRRGVAYNNPQVANRFGDQGRGKARDQARQKMGQGGMGQGGMGQGGMGQGGMGQGGMGQGGMGGQGMGGGMGGMGGMGQGGMGGVGQGDGRRNGRHGRAEWLGMGGMTGGMAGMAGGGCGVGGMGFSGGGGGEEASAAAAEAEEEASAAAEGEVSAAVVDAAVVAGAVAAAGDPTSN